MVHFNKEDDYLDYVKGHPNCKIIVYGAGYAARRNLYYMGHIDYFCDQRAKEIGKINDILCLQPEELLNITGELIILICITNEDVVEEINLLLCKLPISAEVFYFFENSSFSCFDTLPYSYRPTSKEKLRIRIVSENDGWILTKFAIKLQEELSKLGQEVDVSTQEDPTADVNHYIHFERLKKIYNRFISVRTTMITHVDSLLLRDMVHYQANNNVIGICMSSDTLEKLSMWGIQRDRLCYVNPAQDGDILPRKIVIGITSQCVVDSKSGKGGSWLVQICRKLDFQFFRLEIMGQGWNDIINQLKRLGFEVTYYPKFDRKVYRKIIPSLDYWISYEINGYDMGYVDALSAGIKTIVSAGGFYSELQNSLTVLCDNIQDFINVLQKIQEDKKEIIDAVKNWTWESYARKHLEIWQYLTKSKPLRELYAHQSEYMDGIFSLLVSDNRP